jgi:hypothetical protein
LDALFAEKRETMKRWLLCSLFVLVLAVPRAAEAQSGHLWWHGEDPGKPQEKRTLLYGEVEVLASGPGIYFCGVNWPGGYCGVQEHAEKKRNTIFSLWDTSPTLHPSVVQAEERTVCKRFGGEGTGAHTHLDYAWEEGQPFRFAVAKQPDKSGENTLITFYFFDATLNKWVLEATISSPNGNQDSVRYFLRPNMNSFLENFNHQHLEVPKLCLYRLWAGTAPENLVFLRKARGDGLWGVLNDSFYLAQGSAAAAVDALIAKQPKSKDSTIGFIKGAKFPLSIPDRKLPADTIAALKALPKPDPQAEQKTQP